MVYNAIDNTRNSVAHATSSSAMQVHWVSAAGVERHAVADLPVLIAREDGFVWVDLPAWDEQATAVLVDVFGCHLLAIQDCRQRNHVPKVHAYANHLFVILHAPELGAAGHVHLLELDQFIGRRYLITVHGPLGVGVPSLRRSARPRPCASALRPGAPA